MSEDPNRIPVVPHMPTLPEFNMPDIAPVTVFNDIRNELKNVTQELKEINTKLSEILSKLPDR